MEAYYQQQENLHSTEESAQKAGLLVKDRKIKMW